MATLTHNEVLRDELVKYSYPFDERSSLEDGDFYIGTDVFIDAQIYLKYAAVLPLHLGAFDGTSGDRDEMKIVLMDKNGTIKASTTCIATEDTAVVYDNYGVRVGVFVFDPAGLRRLIGRVDGKVISVDADVAALSLDVVKVSEVKFMRYITVGDTGLYGNVKLVARHGLRFALSEDNVLSLDIIGEQAETKGQPVLSINGVKNRSIWLTHHPRVNLRISSENNKLTFIRSEDAT